MDTKTLKVRKVTLTDAEGSVTVYHILNEHGEIVKKCFNKSEVLKYIFGTHAKLYQFLGIDDFQAVALDWDPSGESFDPKLSEGYRYFLKANGRIEERVVAEMTINEFLNIYLSDLKSHLS